MFERFSALARHVVVLSQEEARRLNHNYIGTEHILLGLLAEPEGIAHRVLDGFDITLDGVRQEVIAKVGEGKQKPQARIPFTPRAKKTLELSLREALRLNHNYIGTEHILLGVIREGEGVAAQILRGHAELLAIRAAVIDQTPAWPGSEGGRRLGWLRRRGGGGQPGGPEGSRELPVLTATPAADVTLAEAARMAGAQPVGSHHLLLAALADSGSAAAKALVSLGVDLGHARDALRGVDIAGTTDEAPEEAGRRQMNIQVTSELVTVVAADPVLVEAGQAALVALAAAGGEGGESGAPGGVIRGADLRGAAANSLGAAWEALRDSLVEISHASDAAEQDDPDTPETGTLETGTGEG